MNDRYKDFFKDNPWEGIELGAYPSSARKLYIEDARFWVSRCSKGRFLFFVEESGFHDFDVVNHLDCLDLSLEHVSGNTRLVCSLEDAEMFDKFQTVAKDVASFSKDHTGIILLKRIVARIYSWSEFLKPSRSGIGFRELIGFWGELFIFSKFFVDVCGFENALIAWVGPDNKKQDFTFNNSAFEIKTNIVGDDRGIRISSIEQLQNITSNLYLVVLTINESDLSGVTLQMLVEKCISATSENEVLKQQFLHKIADKYGKANDAELVRKFVDINLTVYEVSDDFPKIVPENLPHDRILKAAYTIDGNSLENFATVPGLMEILENESATEL